MKDARMVSIGCVDAFSNGSFQWMDTNSVPYRADQSESVYKVSTIRGTCHISACAFSFQCDSWCQQPYARFGVASVGVKGAKSDPSDSLVTE